jgi:hypothetical protein
MRKAKSKSKSKSKLKSKLKSKSKSESKSKPKSKSKSKSAISSTAPQSTSRSNSPGGSQPKAASAKPATKPKAKTAPKPQTELRAATLRAADTPAPAQAPSATPINQIIQIAAASAIARFNWDRRGVAPAAYIKGMALVYARVVCKLGAGDSAVAVMAKANTGSNLDALALYDDVFQAAGMKNDVSGIDTLRHLFVLLIGLGMRESSGQHCTGRDTTAHNVSADSAEAGLFQTSFNAAKASPELPKLFARYSANPSGFLDVFQQGVSCSPSDLENFGSGPGADFQRLSKTCPAFAAEFAALGLRTIRTHWGPIIRKEAQVRPECDAMLMQVQNAVNSSANFCAAVQ